MERREQARARFYDRERRPSETSPIVGFPQRRYSNREFLILTQISPSLSLGVPQKSPRLFASGRAPVAPPSLGGYRFAQFLLHFGYNLIEFRERVGVILAQIRCCWRPRKERSSTSQSRSPLGSSKPWAVSSQELT